ncbi:MAG: twin-arginine translocase TatA/TatE family subunit [Bdellovibrio sp.]
MFGLGMSEIIFLAILALIVIGPKELPELARTLGRFLNELKRSTNVLSDELKQQVRIDRLDLEESTHSKSQPPSSQPSVAEEETTSSPTDTDKNKPT